MEPTLGFSHFLSQADGVARFVLGIMLIASLGTWYLIFTKGAQLFSMRRKSQAFLAAFWDAPNLEAVAARIRENGTDEPFSHLVHHGFTAIEQHKRCDDATTGSLIERGTQNDLLTRSLKRAIELGGEPVRDVIRKDPRFNPVRENREFKALVPPIQQQGLPMNLPGMPML